MNWKYWLILIISVIFLLIAPGLFTQIAIFDFWKFDPVTGSVGDTIGGTTAPIVGLISIFLLVVTLWEQKKSNESQLKYMRDEKFESTFFNLLNEQREIQKIRMKLGISIKCMHNLFRHRCLPRNYLCSFIIAFASQRQKN